MFRKSTQWLYIPIKRDKNDHNNKVMLLKDKYKQIKQSNTHKTNTETQNDRNALLWTQYKSVFGYFVSFCDSPF